MCIHVHCSHQKNNSATCQILKLRRHDHPMCTTLVACIQKTHINKNYTLRQKHVKCVSLSKTATKKSSDWRRPFGTDDLDFGRLVLKQEKSTLAHMQDSMPSSAKPLSTTFFLNMSRNLTAAASQAALSSHVSLGSKINASTPGQLLGHLK